MDTATTTPTRKLGRPLALVVALAALALAFSAMAAPAFADTSYQVWLHEPHQGADSTDFTPDEDCGEFETGVVWHFILNQYSGNAATLHAEFDGAGSMSASASKVLTSTQHFYLNTPTDDILVNAYAEVDSPPGDANLVLSHVCHTGEENTASLMIRKTSTVFDPETPEHFPYLAGAIFEVEGIDGQFVTNEDGFFCITGLPQNTKWVVTEIQAPEGYELADPASQEVWADNDGDCTSRDAVFRNAPKEEESPSPSPSEEETASPTPEESEEVSTSSPTASPTTEGSVEAGTGTPAPSLPDGAMSATGGPSPLPTVLFGLILVASLTTLAWVNVKAVRSRA